jgi:succinate dehydrogenase/fumarate reductase flavoprotein subunit
MDTYLLSFFCNTFLKKSYDRGAFQVEIDQYDVVCIGSGVAGMMAAISAAERGLNVCVVSKDPVGWGNTRISGGIVTTNESNEKALYEDVLRTGEHINQKKLVKSLLSRSKTINDLVEKWGHIYLRNPDNPGEKELVKPGGHSIPRTLKSYNRGISIANSLRSKFLALDIKTLEEVVVCRIMVRDEKARGVLCYDWVNNKWIGIISSNIILACGGGGMIYYPHSDNMKSATGDGYALGLLAGAKLIDMEQIQFIPFGILYPEGMKGLEVGDTSAAGPYGVLRNRNGEIVVDDLPNKTRESVSRAIAIEVQRGYGSPHGGLWLDPTENRKYEDGEKNWQHWKSIGTMNTLKMAYGSKAAQWLEKFEVSPTQHYCIGGIHIDENGRTNISGLYAAGETAGGFHGAGRMGSMSLFEGLTFGKVVGEEIIKNTNTGNQMGEDDFRIEKQKIIEQFNYGNNYKPIRLKRELSKIVWENAGIIRIDNGLKTALKALNDIKEKSRFIHISFEHSYNHQFLEAIELQFMLLTAQSVILSALQRIESRGSHYRSDYPVKDLKWQKKNVLVKYSQEKLLVEG